MSQKSGSLSVHSETHDLAALAATHGPALSDDLYNVIRAIVPPPPLVRTPTGLAEASNQHSSLSEGLFTRRPTEESLLGKVNEKSSSLTDVQPYLEEIFIQLVEPLKYSDAVKVLDSVSYLMKKWPNNEFVQEQALKCLECLSKDCDDLRPSRMTVLLVLQAMKAFHRNEMIQRMGVKILKHKNFLHLVEKKIEVADVVLSSLCKLPEVDDFVLHAKDIIGELEPSEKAHIRSRKQYIEMLLDFPNRKNNNITIYLCWTALETLDLLADLDEKWDVLINANGEARLLKLSGRPEFEDRCKKLLRKVFPPVSKTTPGSKNVDDFCSASVTVDSAYTKERQKINTHENYSAVIQKQPEFSKEQNGWLSSFSRIETMLDPPLDRYIMPVLPVDELITRKCVTPSPTVADKDEVHSSRFSDEMIHTMRSPYTPLASPSPSYSPPPEDCAVQAEHFGEPQSPNPSVENRSKQTKTIVNVTIQHGRDRRAQSVSSQNTTPVVQCFICNEPKGRRPLLSRQLKQISHCLQKPCNVLLFNCLEANLCQDHRM